jgi:ribosomal peptide maturation radical SAM protein 1
MYRICLINMPFANLAMPSIALTQIKSVIESRFPGKVSIDIKYLSHDFARYVGVDLYNYVSNDMHVLYAGLGDWFFRQVAFPQLPDNTEKYLHRFFRGNGLEVQWVRDLIAQKRHKLDTYMEELISKYELDQVQMVGFTSMFMQNVATFAMAKKLKQHNPSLVTVMGGANCEFPMGRVIAERVSDIEYVFSGPALKSFPDFVQCHLEGDMAKCSSIPGVFAKGGNLSRFGPETLGEEVSIDTPIELDYRDFMRRFDEYFADSGFKAVLPVETSRGCWWGQRAHCTFCGLNGASMAYRAMKPELAIQQFKTLFRYSGKVSMLEAVDNILAKNYLQEVLPFLETPAEMSIFYEVKADLSEQDIAVLAKARVNMIQPGIESLATSTLKLMKKGTTAFQNVTFLKHCVFFGVTPFWNLLVGFPGESAEVYKRYLVILPLLVHLPPPSGVYPVRFDRYSPYHKDAQSYRLDLRPMDFYPLIYPFNESDLRDFAYYFSDRNLIAEYFKDMTEWIQPLWPLVAHWQGRWANADGSLPPRLFFKNASDVVCDSRSGSMVEHTVGKTGKAILDRLSRPMRIEELIKVFSAQPGAEVSERAAFLEERGLIFREGDRVLSLVLDRDHEGQEQHQLAELGAAVQ